MLRILISLAFAWGTATAAAGTKMKFNESEDDEWLSMPGGFEIHASCVHRHDGDFTVESGENGETVLTSERGEMTRYAPCAYAPRRKRVENVGYYSDWSVYAQSTISDAVRFGSFSAEWTVPQTPKSRGPLGLSSVYFFPGLEDGGGHHGNASLILQPVLQYGKSGCVLNPLNWGSWHLMSYLVTGDGRAHCGKKLNVDTGDKLRGSMVQDPTSGEWTVTSVALASNSTSTYSATLADNPAIDAAYITMEGMIIYGCDAYPPGGGIDFTNLAATDANGRSATLRWTKELRHTECSQDVDAANDGSRVTLKYQN